MIFIWLMRNVRSCLRVKVITTFLGMSALGGWPAYAHSESGRQERISQQEGDRARVTVTAFVNISENPSDDWWGIGIAEVVAVGLE